MKLLPNESRTYNQLSRYLYISYATGYLDISIQGTKMRVSAGTKFDFAQIHQNRDIMQHVRTDITITNPNAVELDVDLHQGDIDIDGMSYNLQATHNQDLLNAINTLTNGIGSLNEKMTIVSTKLDKLEDIKTNTTNANTKLEDVKTKLDTTNTKLTDANTTLTAIKNK